ncbi:MAG: MotA/TolQ/ExbB proton channel family protein [Verrucomicrobia bacterium]|nr:MotA/TolQ/ExbB proton channel family protein [Verrucomicrobiota bacterium]
MKHTLNLASNIRWIATGAVAALALAAPDAAWAADASGKTLMDHFKEGGVVMFPLLACSILILGVILELAYKVRLPKCAPPPVVDQLQKAVTDGNYQEAWRVCNSNPCTLSSILKPAIQRVGRGKEVVQTILEEHAMKEAMVWRSRIAYLSMIGVIAPMFGLMGTVTGMIRAFAAIAAGGIFADPTRLSAAISECLVATATGLFVAVPGFVAFYFFRNRIQSVVVGVEDTINRILDDVPFEQLQGIKIGAQLEAELGGSTAAPAEGGAAAAPAGGDAAPKPAPAAGAVMVPCPNCNAQIPQGIPNCPHCKAQLEWA